MIQEALTQGQQFDFGENYVQELIEKAPRFNTEETTTSPSSSSNPIRWHFIGHLQSNKVRALIHAVPNLAYVHTVDRPKIARELNKEISTAIQSNLRSSASARLNVLVQVNTSEEESKSGADVNSFMDVVRTVVTECTHLRFVGLMTIGKPGQVRDFELLHQCRERVCAEFGWSQEDVELSMGMSGDFEQAIQYGATMVRVGSSIFGERDYNSNH